MKKLIIAALSFFYCLSIQAATLPIKDVPNYDYCLVAHTLVYVNIMPPYLLQPVTYDIGGMVCNNNIIYVINAENKASWFTKITKQ